MTTPIEAVVRTAPHPYPILELVPEFSYFYKGIDLMDRCGEPTISVLDKVLAEGTLADFVSVNWDNLSKSYTMTIAPIN